MNKQQTTLAACLTAFALAPPGVSMAHAAAARGFAVKYLSPLPDSRYVLPSTTIIIATDRPIDMGAASGLIRDVRGSRSGGHQYSIRISDDDRTVICTPTSPFVTSEEVSVEVDTSVANWRGPASTGSFRFTITGHLADYSALRGQMRAEDFPGRGTMQGPVLRRRALSGGDVLPNINVTLSSATAPGNLFLADLYWSVPSIPALMILRNDGTRVFARDLQGNGYDFKPQPNGMLTYFDDAAQAFLVMNGNFAVIDTISCANGYDNDPHELRVLPNGHALLFGLDPEIVDMSGVVSGGSSSAYVVGYVIQELDQQKNLVFQWRTWDHFALTDAQNIDLTASWIDWVHCNALDIDTDGNLILSSRHLNEITKISRQTGDIIWRFGGKNNQFRFVNDALGFSFQHAVRRIANGNITLFDNGYFHVPAFSRAVEYRLDETAKTATLVWQYRNTPDVVGFAMGYVQRMENGNTLIGWGTGNPTVTEVAPDGSKVFEMTFDTGVYSYRAYRYEWEPGNVTTAPARTPPAAFALAQNYPNPFNPTTIIQYSLPQASRVRLEVFNLLGERVSTLVDGEKGAGVYSERLDGTNLASGVYYYRLKAGDFTSTHKMVLLH